MTIWSRDFGMQKLRPQVLKRKNAEALAQVAKASEHIAVAKDVAEASSKHRNSSEAFSQEQDRAITVLTNIVAEQKWLIGTLLAYCEASNNRSITTLENNDGCLFPGACSVDLEG